MSNSKIADAKLADAGRLRIEWAESRMPVLMHLRELGKKNLPLRGMKVAGCLHVTKETAVLIGTIRAAGAEVSWSGCNPLSTQDDVAAALAAEGTSIYAWHGLSTDEFYWCIDKTLEMKPTLTLDDGADLIFRVHDRYKELAKDVIGGTEETTTGVHRLYDMAKTGSLLFPCINVNDSVTKSKFDNLYGCRHSLIDGINRATDVMIAGKTAVICGYGDVGKGCAQSLRGQAARVLITEVDPINALQAAMDGYQVVRLEDVVGTADIFVTATGNRDVITADHMARMKHQAIVGNIGHFDNEIDMAGLAAIPGVERINIKPQVDQWRFADGHTVLVLSEGRLLNLGNATGHPSFVMSNSFTNQTIAQVELFTKNDEYEKQVYVLPKHLDEKVARLHLDALGAKLTELTEAQAAYIGVPVEGPYKSEHYRY